MPVSGSTSVAAQRMIRLVTLSRACRSRSPARAGRTRARPASRRRRDWRESAADGPARRPSVSIAATEARLMIETTLAATSEKLWPSACSTFGGPRSSAGMKRRKNASIASRPSSVREVAARGLAAVVADDERVASRRRSGCRSCGQPLVAHQHQEAGLGQIARALPGRSRRARSRWRIAGRPVTVWPGVKPRARPDAPGSGPSPDSGRSLDFRRSCRALLTKRSRPRKAAMKNRHNPFHGAVMAPISSCRAPRGPGAAPLMQVIERASKPNDDVRVRAFGAAGTGRGSEA